MLIASKKITQNFEINSNITKFQNLWRFKPIFVGPSSKDTKKEKMQLFWASIWFPSFPCCLKRNDKGVWLNLEITLDMSIHTSLVHRCQNLLIVSKISISTKIFFSPWKSKAIFKTNTKTFCKFFGSLSSLNSLLGWSCWLSFLLPNSTCETHYDKFGKTICIEPVSRVGRYPRRGSRGRRRRWKWGVTISGCNFKPKYT